MLTALPGARLAAAMAHKPALPAADALRALADAQDCLMLRVTPNAGADTLTVADGIVQVRVTATPEAGKANAAVLALLAKALGVPKSALSIVRGETGRDKRVRLPPR
ncbi:DUF167 domain-containing protein [Sandarakinorhabdus limnophila]|jgi:uncharacterized protein YggU (UPF0235/DUF167 family)|uniref:DUF167 domain-containing protein n=1 Tax=Sandarakinorhabdus limnophila TaxID=210512 RepID=UPI0026F192EA|nr:DUF167 domain-containing protein [Sandarakinorhabdus limnophila]